MADSKISQLTSGTPTTSDTGVMVQGGVNKNFTLGDLPISTATQTALDGKVDKETGKGLSTNDYTTTEKNKLAGIENGAEVNPLNTDELSEGLVNKYDKIVSILAGAGIGITGTYPNFTVTNSSPDQIVSLTAGTNVTITGTYPNFTINAAGGSGGGDMYKSTYDTNNNGIVDNSEKLGGELPSYYQEKLVSGTNIKTINGISVLGGGDIVIEGGGSGGHTIQEEGVSLTQRTKLNFVGTNITATDDAINDTTIITVDTIPGTPLPTYTISNDTTDRTIDLNNTTLGELSNVLSTHIRDTQEGLVGPQGPQGIQGVKGDTGEQGPQGTQGIQGEQGPAGLDGDNGVGVPTGGTAGQVLSKIDGTDYNTQWTTPASSDVSSTRSTFVAGENITAGDALRNGNASVITGYLVNITQNVGGYTTTTHIGKTTDDYERGESFILETSSVINNCSIYLAKVGTPDTTLNLEIFSDAGFSTLVGTSTNSVVSNALTTSLVKTTFNFSGLTLNAGTYYLKINIVSGSLNNSNYVFTEFSTTNVYAGTIYKISTTGAVVANSPASTYDLRFVLNDGYSNTTYYEDETKVYKTDASNSSKINFIGFASANASTGGNVIVDTSGVSNTQTINSADIGKDFYLANALEAQLLENGDYSGSVSAVGYSTTYYEVGQSFTTSALKLSEIKLKLRKTGSPTSVINLKLYSDATFTTLVATSTNTVNATSLTTSLVDTSFNFNEIELNGTYWMKISVVSGSVSTSNYVSVGYYQSDIYSKGTWYRINNTNIPTNISSFDLYFEVIGKSGTISTIPGTNIVRVGKAVSATGIEINTDVGFYGYAESPNQTLTVSTLTKITLNTGVIGPISSSRYTARTNGLYKITANFVFVGTASTTFLRSYIYKNGVGNHFVEFGRQAGNNNCHGVLNKIMFLNSGDTIELYANAFGAGGNLQEQTSLIVEKID